MKTGILFALFFGCHCLGTVHAQSKKIDSLQNLSQRLKGSKRIDAINTIAFEWFMIDLDSANNYITLAERLSNKYQYAPGLAEANVYKGIYEYLKGNNDKGKYFLRLGMHRAAAAGYTKIEGYGLIQLGNLYRNLSAYDSARISYDKAYVVLKDSLNPWYLSSLYSNKAKYYGLIAQPEKEIQYLIRSWRIRELLDDVSLKIDALVLLSDWYLKQHNKDKALAYLDQAESLSNDEVPDEIKLTLKYQKALLFFQQGDYAGSLKLYIEVRDFYQRNSNTHSVVVLMTNVGHVFERIGNYEVSLKSYFDALKIAEAKNYVYDQVKIDISIGWIYNLLQQPDQAKKFLSRAIEGAKQYKYHDEEGNAYDAYGKMLASEKKFDEAIVYFNKARHIFDQIQFKIGKANALNHLGDVYEMKSNFKEALHFQQEGLKIQESVMNQSGMGWSYLALARVNSILGNQGMAVFYLEKAEASANKLGMGTILVEVYKIQRDLLEQSGRTKEALYYSKLYETLKDSIFNETLGNRISNLQTLYEMEQRDHAIELLTKNKQLQEGKLEIQNAQLQQQWIIILAAVVGFLFACSVAAIIYRYYRRTTLLNVQVTERNEEIQAQSEELTEANEALMKLNHAIQDQREEIQAQAEELTESNQTISQINLSLEKMVAVRTQELQQAYKELDTFFYRSSHDFRRPLTTFMGLSEVAKIAVTDPTALNLFDKVNQTARSLDKMLNKLQSISEIGSQELIYKEVFLHDFFQRLIIQVQDDAAYKNISFHTDIDTKSKLNAYPNLLRIVFDNLIENAIQFSGSKSCTVSITVREENGEMIIAVSDQGLGIEQQYQTKVFDMYFRAHETSKGNGLGLYIVKKIVDKMNGVINLASSVNTGTTVSIHLPIITSQPVYINLNKV